MTSDFFKQMIFLDELNKGNDPVTEMKNMSLRFEKLKKEEKLDDLKRAIQTGDVEKADAILEKYEEEEKKERKLERYRRIILGEEKLEKDN